MNNNTEQFQNKIYVPSYNNVLHKGSITNTVNNSMAQSIALQVAMNSAENTVMTTATTTTSAQSAEATASSLNKQRKSSLKIVFDPSSGNSRSQPTKHVSWRDPETEASSSFAQGEMLSTTLSALKLATQFPEPTSDPKQGISNPLLEVPSKRQSSKTIVALMPRTQSPRRTILDHVTRSNLTPLLFEAGDVHTRTSVLSIAGNQFKSKGRLPTLEVGQAAPSDTLGIQYIEGQNSGTPTVPIMGSLSVDQLPRSQELPHPDGQPGAWSQTLGYIQPRAQSSLVVEPLVKIPLQPDVLPAPHLRMHTNAGPSQACDISPVIVAGLDGQPMTIVVRPILPNSRNYPQNNTQRTNDDSYNVQTDIPISEGYTSVPESAAMIAMAQTAGRCVTLVEHASKLLNSEDAPSIYSIGVYNEQLGHSLAYSQIFRPSNQVNSPSAISMNIDNAEEKDQVTKKLLSFFGDEKEDQPVDAIQVVDSHRTKLTTSTTKSMHGVFKEHEYDSQESRVEKHGGPRTFMGESGVSRKRKREEPSMAVGSHPKTMRTEVDNRRRTIASTEFSASSSAHQGIPAAAAQGRRRSIDDPPREPGRSKRVTLPMVIEWATTLNRINYLRKSGKTSPENVKQLEDTLLRIKANKDHPDLQVEWIKRVNLVALVKEFRRKDVFSVTTKMSAREIYELWKDIGIASA